MNDDYAGSPAYNLPVRKRTQPMRKRYPAVSTRARETFLDSLRQGLTVNHSAELAGLKYARRLYELRDADPEFREAWADAWEAGTDVMRAEAKRRAVDGVDEAIVSAGKILGTQKVYSDRLLERLLASRDPNWRNNAPSVQIGIGPDTRTTIQSGVTTESVFEMLATHAPHKLEQFLAKRALEAPEGSAEITDVQDEPAETDSRLKED